MTGKVVNKDRAGCSCKAYRDAGKNQKLQRQAVNADQTGKAGNQSGNSKPQQYKSAGKDLSDNESKAEHAPQDPDPIAHLLLSRSSVVFSVTLGATMNSDVLPGRRA